MSTTAEVENARRSPIRPRITVDVSPELRREIRLEAARRDVSITDYVTQLILEGRKQEGDAESVS